MKKLFTLSSSTVFVLVLLLVGNFASAQKNPDMERYGKMKQEHKEKFKEKKDEIQNRLNLTEEQKAQAKKFHEEARPEIKPVVEKIKAKRQEIIEMKKSGASQEQLKAKMEEMKPLIDEANRIREKNAQKFESILTPEQKVEFQKIKEEVKQKREQMKEKMKGNFQQHKMEMKGNSAPLSK
ncbi:MAG TPA: Spy/CpxP family protein refolding chaperone [Candidatus Gastranaerophilales bacterium]|nr:Spy/CpxP family protein refolding chaperone [Candidatus Gastranaerophilales bacterium]